MTPNKDTNLYQAKRIKDPEVRKRVIDYMGKFKSYGDKRNRFALINMISWGDTSEGCGYWDNLNKLYGSVSDGVETDYIAAEPIEETTTKLISVTQENYKIGARVVRGKNWMWGNQDNYHRERNDGELYLGTITELSRDGWVRVKWDAGSSDTYRINKQYDLYFADAEDNKSLPAITDPKVWIHCTTENEAIEITKMFHDLGLSLNWSGGQSYSDTTFWDTHKAGTVYSGSRGTYAEIGYIKRVHKDAKIYAASDFINSKNSINNKKQKQEKDEKSINKCEEHTETTGIAAYVCAKAQTVGKPERRTGVAIQYRGCKVITRTGHTPNGTPTYGM